MNVEFRLYKHFTTDIIFSKKVTLSWIMPFFKMEMISLTRLTLTHMESFQLSLQLLYIYLR